ncbi:MAG: hypothetical protein ACJ741_10065 [Pyrinomonadaceae bacterium]
MSMKIAATLFLVLGLASSSVTTRGLSNHERLYHSPFRYVIVHDEIKEDVDAKFTNRQVEVLLDEKSFSEETLKTLFRLLSKRFSQPDRLDVEVYTSLEQIDTPEERELGRVFAETINGRGKPSAEELVEKKYPHAILMRQDGNELFRYTVGRDNRRLVTVVLKGKDPAGHHS